MSENNQIIGKKLMINSATFYCQFEVPVPRGMGGHVGWNSDFYIRFNLFFLFDLSNVLTACHFPLLLATI